MDFGDRTLVCLQLIQLIRLQLVEGEADAKAGVAGFAFYVHVAAVLSDYAHGVV